MTAVKIESESSNNRGGALPIGLLFTPSRWEGPLALIRGLHGIYYWCRYPGYRLGVFTILKPGLTYYLNSRMAKSPQSQQSDTEKWMLRSFIGAEAPSQDCKQLQTSD